ncbi:MAG: hypothetical protein WD749_00035, partial [Phycisphaerales bacterium]
MRSCARPVVALISACGLAAAVSPAAAQYGVLQDARSRVFPDGRGPEPSGGGGADTSNGPDVIVGELMWQDSGGSISLNLDLRGSTATHLAYGIGTTSCNIGNVNLQWIGGSALKPVIPQNAFRLKTVDGSTRLEQVGQSWMKHAFTALTQNACADMWPGQSCNGAGGSVLGIRCSDPYTASRNSSQSNPSGSGGSGPRYQVNPFTGEYPWPVGTMPTITDGTSRRIRVLRTDLEVTTATTATQYFGEALYVNRDDARWGNGKNNASYRRMFWNGPTHPTQPNDFVMEGDGTYNKGMHRQVPAIYAWRDYGKIATNPASPLDNDVMMSEVTTGHVFAPTGAVRPEGDGWHIIGSKATDLGNGLHHYEYAVYNLSSDRMGGSFTVPVPAGAVISNVEWRGVDSHSGFAAEDATRNEPWDITVNPGSVVFAAHTPYSGSDYAAKPITGVSTGNPATVTSANHGLVTGNYVAIVGCNATASGTGINHTFIVTVVNANQFTVPIGVTGAGTTGTFGSPSILGNGIRWGTMYNFRFDSTAAPASGQVTLGFYKRDMPGYPNSVDGAAWVPSVVPPPVCYANCDESTTAPVLNVADFGCFLTRYAAGEAYANCDESTTAPVLNVADF